MGQRRKIRLQMKNHPPSRKTRTTESEKEPSTEKGGLSKKRKTRSGESEKESSSNLDEGTPVITKKTRVTDSGQEASNVAVELNIKEIKIEQPDLEPEEATSKKRTTRKKDTEKEDKEK